MSTEQCRDLDQLHPKVKELALKLIEECKKAGLNIKISETYRTIERQDYLYAQGRSRLGNIVTNAKGSSMSSYHQWRLAFDIYNNVPGDAYNTSVLKKSGVIGKKIGLEWGGGWSGFKDSPHFQYTFGLSIADLKTGKKPPAYPAVPKEDTELINAAQKLHLKGIITSPESWASVDKINLKYVPALISKMGGVDRLLKDKVISDKLLWTKGNYTVAHVRSLIIKYSKIG